MRLNKENLPTWLIGILFSIDTITYTLTSVLLNCRKEKNKNYQKLVAYGVLLFFVAMMLTGPTPGIFPDELWIITLGVLL